MNHTDLLKKALRSSGKTVTDFAQNCGISRDGFYKWRSDNFVPESRREAVANASRGAIKAENFTPKFYPGDWRRGVRHLSGNTSGYHNL